MLGHRGRIRISLALCLATFLLTIGLTARAGGVPPDNAILSAYNDGTRLLQKQEFAQAAEILKPVTEKAPDYAPAHGNYGAALLQLGRYDEAKVELLKATELDPSQGPFWISLGSCLQTLGDTPGALKAFRQFLKLSPGHPMVNQVKAIVTGLESEERRSASAVPVKENPDDYLNEAIQVGISRWPANRMPILVYIKSGASVPGYRAEFLKILKESFEEWQTATDGTVSFKFIDSPTNGGIACSWTDDPNKMISKAEGGHAETISDSQGILRCDITLLTAPVYNRPSLTDNYARYIDLHEIGHALGILGHSRSHEDVLFSTLPPTDANCHLSKRDANTLMALYKLDASQVKNTPLDAERALNSGDPNSVPMRILRLNVEAQSALNSGNLPVAIEKLQSALKLDPSNQLIQANLGVSYTNAASMAAAMRNWPQADRYFKLAIPMLEKGPDKSALVKCMTSYSSVLHLIGRAAEASAIDTRIKALQGN